MNEMGNNLRKLFDHQWLMEWQNIERRQACSSSEWDATAISDYCTVLILKIMTLKREYESDESLP